MSATELLPCPFCGGEAKLFSGLHSVDGDVYPLYGVCCLAAQVGTYGVEHTIYGYFYEYRAVEAWNTRARGTCRPEEQYLDSHSDLTVTVCSECRVPIDDLEDCNYCPSCGRRVVDDCR